MGDEITEPTVHLCWSEHAIRRAGEVLRAAGLDIMAGHVEEWLPTPAEPTAEALVLAALQQAHHDVPPFETLARQLLDQLEERWVRAHVEKVSTNGLDSMPPAPECGQLYPNTRSSPCPLPQGHGGPHGSGLGWG